MKDCGNISHALTLLCWEQLQPPESSACLSQRNQGVRGPQAGYKTQVGILKVGNCSRKIEDVFWGAHSQRREIATTCLLFAIGSLLLYHLLMGLLETLRTAGVIGRGCQALQTS